MMRVNPFTAAFAEVGQYFRRSTTDKNQALSDFSIPGVLEDRVSLSDKAVKKLSDTETDRPGKGAVVASSYYFIEGRVPKVELLDNAASAYQVHNDLEFLRQQKNPSGVADNLPFKSPFIDKQIRSFIEISAKLSSLKKTVETVNQAENFNTKSAKSLQPNILTATTSSGSPTGNFKINVSQLADGQQLVSDTVSDPFAGLSVSGAIQINGFEINIDTSDSLNDIKDKINFGEDLNKNGMLDLGEDLNKNGTLEVIRVSSNPYAKGIYINEDINGDNIIQDSEDSNGNKLLDGGIAELEAVASIINDRLYLNPLSNMNKKIELTDDNSILLNLGFFELDKLNNPILKEQQLDADTFENLNKSSISSSLTVNGYGFEKEVNNISDIIPDTTLHLKNISSENVSLSISTDLTEAFANIKKFVNTYNDTIRFLNGELAFSKVLEKNVAVQKIRNGLNDKVMDDVLNADQKFNNLEKIGITGQNKSKNTFNQVAIKNLATNLKRNISDVASLPSKGSSSIFAGLEKVGIRTMEDDTLAIDERNLKKMLKKNTGEVINLFTNTSSGVAGKLGDFIDTLINPSSGTVDIQVANKNTLLSDTYLASDLIRNAAIAKASQFEQSNKEKILISVKV